MNFKFHSAFLRRSLALLLAVPMLLGCMICVNAEDLPREEDVNPPDYLTSVPDVVPSDRTTVVENVKTVILPGCVKEGYIFLGWNTSAKYDGTHYDVGDTYIVDGIITLYGEWRRQESKKPGVEDIYAIDPVRGPSGTLVPGFSVTSSGMPNIPVLNQQAEDATPAGQRFDCWRITTATVDEYIAPDRAERRIRQILETETDITLCAYYVWK